MSKYSLDDNWHSWTSQELNTLRRMLAAGAGRKEIVDAIGRSYNSVRGMMRRIHGNRIREEIVARYAQKAAEATAKKAPEPDVRPAPPQPSGERDPYERCTRLHLQDIHREHGFNASWLTLNIGNEPAGRPRFYPALVGSPVGSSAAMCAEANF